MLCLIFGNRKVRRRGRAVYLPRACEVRRRQGVDVTKEYSNPLLDRASMNVHYPMTILFLTFEDNGASGRFKNFFCRFQATLYRVPQRFRAIVQPVYFCH